ncbi:unnamed protein product [Closterium sp. NIES-53]
MLSGALESTDGARRDPPRVPDEPQVSALDFLTRKTPAAIPVTTTAVVETPPPVISSPNVITSCNDEPHIPSQSTSDATKTTTQPNPAEAESLPQPVSASVGTTLPAISVSRIIAGNGKYKQRILSFARPTAGFPPATVPRFSTPRPGPSQPVAANDDDKYPRSLTGLDIERISGISTDGASVMVGSQTGLVARLRARIPHLAGFHCIVHREALAAKDAAEAYPDLDIVDHVVRSLAELLGRSGNFHLRFKELQEVLCETNLELHGIHIVRWLSRGLAVQRLADNLPAAVILLYLPVRAFPLPLMCVWQVDVTHVLQMVDNTRLTLRNHYLSDADDFGDGSNELNAFLSKHASSEKREVKRMGTDSTGAPTTHEYTLHEQNIKGQKSGPGLDDCITLAKGYVKELLKRLESRMKDLGSLDGAKLFTQGAYPKSHSKRQRRFLQWLEALRNLFKRKPSDPDTLPGTSSISVVID